LFITLEGRNKYPYERVLERGRDRIEVRGEHGFDYGWQDLFLALAAALRVLNHCGEHRFQRVQSGYICVQVAAHMPEQPIIEKTSAKQ
jgi:hypothetical protein